MCKCAKFQLINVCQGHSGSFRSFSWASFANVYFYLVGGVIAATCCVRSCIFFNNNNLVNARTPFGRRVCLRLFWFIYFLLVGDRRSHHFNGDRCSMSASFNFLPTNKCHFNNLTRTNNNVSHPRRSLLIQNWIHSSYPENISNWF